MKRRPERLSGRCQTGSVALFTLSTKEWVLLGSISAAMSEQAVGLCMDTAQQQHYQGEKKKRQ